MISFVKFSFSIHSEFFITAIATAIVLNERLIEIFELMVIVTSIYYFDIISSIKYRKYKIHTYMIQIFNKFIIKFMTKSYSCFLLRMNQKKKKISL